MEKINDYLIDLLFLIKSKKNKNNNFVLFNFQINLVEFDMLQQMLIELLACWIYGVLEEN